MRPSGLGFAVLLAFVTIGSADAQLYGIVSSAKSKSPEEGVEVFINNTAIAAVTGNDGKFSLENIPEGYMELVLYKKGFDLYRSVVKIQRGKGYNLALSITPSLKRKSRTLSSERLAALNGIVSSQGVVGIYSNEVRESTVQDSTILTADHPVGILNQDFGFRVYCYIVNMNGNSYQEMPIRFEYMTPKNILEGIRWERNRMEVYKGSLSHWLSSLQANSLAAEGFKITRSDDAPVDAREIVSSSGADKSHLDIPEPVRVTYRKSNGTEQVSTVLTNGSVVLHTGGTMLNSRLLKVGGRMGWQRPGMQIPADYEPIKGDVEHALEENIRLYFEKPYVHVDKPYYYPGEAIWLKTYLNYYSTAMSEQLSRVIYVELISPEKKVIQRKVFRIDKGSAWGEFNLSDSLQAGLYYLRSYTNLSRNFGEEGIFLKPFHIVNVKDKVAPLPGDLTAPTNQRIVIKSDKSEYKQRERITVDLAVKDKSGNATGANISIAVTDAIQVVPVSDYTSIEQAGIDEKRIDIQHDDWFEPENGITFSGVFVGENGKPEKRATLGFTHWSSGFFTVVETDELGRFAIAGLQHVDTSTYFFNSNFSRKVPYGKIIPDPVNIIPVELPAVDYPINVISTSSVQRIVSEYEAPKDVRVLKEVEIRSTRIEEPPVDYQARPFGRGDHVFNNKDFNPAHESILRVIQGRVPGVTVSENGGRWYVSVLRASASFSGPGSPVIIVDNVILTGDAINGVLSTMHPSTVESISVTTRPSAMLGSRGSQGIIMVYTKQWADTGGKNFNGVVISGFSESHPFIARNHDDPSVDKSQADYRSIIHWAPQVDVNPSDGTGTFSFYATDLPGKYRIVVEGFTSAGDPLHGEYYVDVVD